MARTVLDDDGRTTTYVEEVEGPATGIVIGVLLALLVAAVVAVLLFRGTYGHKTTPTPGNNYGPGASAPAQPNAPGDNYNK